MNETEAVEIIKRQHGKRRFGMKVQQKVDRAMESYVRINFTDWNVEMDEKERNKRNTEVQAIINKARGGLTAASTVADLDLIELVGKNDVSRAPWDEVVVVSEKAMKKLAMELPIWPFAESVHGLGGLGVATIVAEAGGPLSEFHSVSALWKRLGYGVYDGHAGSTWRREKWRPRTLDKEEWEDVCFSPNRYAMMKQIALWLRNAQWIGAAKTGTGVGEPNGSYGEIYAKRRAHTLITHPDWTDGHRQDDGLRIMMKAMLCDLWIEWRKAKGLSYHVRSRGRSVYDKAVAEGAAGHERVDAQDPSARRASSNDSGHGVDDAQHALAGIKAAGQAKVDAQKSNARRPKSKRASLV